MSYTVTPWVWLIGAAVLAGLEVITPGASLIWLAGAAVLTALASWLLGPPLVVQVAIFVATGIALVLFARVRFARPRMAVHSELNRRADRMVGSLVTVIEPLVGGRGRVQVGDSPWPAVGPDLPAGASARVIRVEGTTLVVEAGTILT